MYSDLIKRAATIKEWCSEKEKQFTFKLTEIDKCDLMSLEAQLKNLKDFHSDEKPPKETEQDAVRIWRRPTFISASLASGTLTHRH